MANRLPPAASRRPRSPRMARPHQLPLELRYHHDERSRTWGYIFLMFRMIDRELRYYFFSRPAKASCFEKVQGHICTHAEKTTKHSAS